MKKSTWMIALGSAAAVLVGGAAVAGRMGDGKHSERAYKFLSWKLEDALDDLDADDGQRARINAIKDRVFQQATPLMTEHQKTRAEVLALLEAPSVDPVKAHALLDQRMDAMRAFGHQAIDAAIEAHGVLNAQQRAEIAAKARKRMDRRH